MPTSFLACAVTTVGILVSFPIVKDIKGSALGILLALSAGALIYVGASHLLPEVERKNKRYSVLALTAGGLIAGCRSSRRAASRRAWPLDRPMTWASQL